MINKQNLWFLTLFSLVLVLGVYYITMPNDLVVNKEEETNNIDATIEILENEYLTVLKQEKEEERTKKKKEYEEILNSSTSTSEDKNNAYLGIKSLTELNSEEITLENKIKQEFDLDSFIKIDDSSIEITIIKDSHDKNLANNIMRYVQNYYQERKIISVNFKK